MEIEIIIPHTIKTIDYKTCHPECPYLNNKYSECKLFNGMELNHETIHFAVSKHNDKYVELNFRCDNCIETTSHINSLDYFGTREIYKIQLSEKQKIDEIYWKSKQPFKEEVVKDIPVGDIVYNGGYRNGLFSGSTFNEIVGSLSLSDLVEFKDCINLSNPDAGNIVKFIDDKIKSIQSENEFI